MRTGREPGRTGAGSGPGGLYHRPLQGGAHETSVQAARWSHPLGSGRGGLGPGSSAERCRGRQGVVPGGLQGRGALHHRRPVRRQAVPGALREPGRGRQAAKEGKPLPDGTVLTLVQYKAQVDAQGNPAQGREGALPQGRPDRLHGDGEARRAGAPEYPDEHPQRRVGVRGVRRRREAQRQGQLQGVLPVPQAPRRRWTS